jgi:hypothetical protein
MASPAQLQANRLNALKSTGPSSVEGKAVTRFNALKHGADSKSILLPGENPEALAALTEQYYKEFAPEGPEQTALCDTIIQGDWNMRRFARIEDQLLAHVVAAIQAEDPDARFPLGQAYLADCKNGNALQKAFRRQQAARRDWDKARIELRRMKMQPTQLAQPSKPAMKPVAPPTPPPPPAQPYRKNGEGKGWLGSEPPEWRL